MSHHQGEDMSDPESILAWHVAMGADEAVSDTPINRFQAPKTETVVKRETKVDQPAPTAPKPVTARPAQPANGAGADAAIHVANQCQSIEELRNAMENFDGGLLKRSAKNTVFADGMAGAPLMIVGEAPGADEDRAGKPFVGVSGQLLDRMINAIGYSRDTNAYISNVVPWRPLGNRTPDQAIIAMCLPFIHRHIALAQPKIIMMVGGVSAKSLLNTEEGITRMRGKWRKITIDDGNSETVFEAMPTYHPAYLLRQPQQKGQAWQDLLAVKEKLDSL